MLPHCIPHRTRVDVRCAGSFQRLLFSLAGSPNQEPADREQSGGETADAPEDFHRQPAKRAEVQRVKCILGLRPPACLPNVAR